MAKRFPYNPFQDLNDFKTLETLISHILHSLNASQIKIVLPASFDVTQIQNPEQIVPVFDILVGDATFNYILLRAAEVIAQVKDRIQKFNSKPELEDKLLIYKSISRELTRSYQYFNSMNPIRYMSNCKWMISYTQYINGKHQTTEIEYPNSKMDLHNEHWNIIENNFIIRRQMVEELLYLVATEIDTINESLLSTQYKWESEDEYEIHELLQAIIASNRVRFIKGDVQTFSFDFLRLVGLQPERIAYYRDKVMNRKKRAIFLSKLEKQLEEYRIPSMKLKRTK